MMPFRHQADKKLQHGTTRLFLTSSHVTTETKTSLAPNFDVTIRSAHISRWYSKFTSNYDKELKQNIKFINKKAT